MSSTDPSPEGALALYLIGGRGAIATSVAHGLAGIRRGLLPPLGLCTQRAPLDALQLAPIERIVLGGCDVRGRGLSTESLRAEGILTAELVDAVAGDVAEYESRLEGGLIDVSSLDGKPDRTERGAAAGDTGEPQSDAFDPRSLALAELSATEQVNELRASIRRLRETSGAAQLVVCNLASTEAFRAPHASWESLAAFESALADGSSAQTLPASSLYAYAAFLEGVAYVNFTPNVGSAMPALREMALARGVPHCGNDGKTGETLLKTTLAPMFAHRALRVLSWQGYNMLGNRDGAVLSDPAHKRAKVENKDEALRSLLDNDDLHSFVGIDYVPSLGDWKTAYDFVHFEGFLGARMKLQFTWEGSDSALAAPLVLDLARLAELALRRGESGELDHTAAFFKSPLAGGTHDFHAQIERLHDYARRIVAN